MIANDAAVLRGLAQQVAEAAARPEMEQRRQEWYRHDALQPGKPMFFASPEGAWIELVPEAILEGESELARSWERTLRQRIYAAEHFRDDQVLDDRFKVAACFRHTWKRESVARHLSDDGWGMKTVYHRTSDRGASVWEAPLQDPADLRRLQQPETVPEEAENRRLMEQAQEVFEGLLRVEEYRQHWWSLSLIGEFATLRGLQQILLDMAERPKFVHETMSFLLAGRQRWLDALEQRGLLSLNISNDYVGSGGFGATTELPGPGFEPGHVRCRDMWGFAENQEACTISPRMFEEFVLNYQLPILERFGLNCYGCCEPIHDRMDAILRVPRLRRLSISPWTDREIAAEKVGRRCIYSWKPNPARLAGIRFDEDLVRREIRETLDIAHGCQVEFVLKDTHTCNNDPVRFDRWCQIAQEEVSR